MSLLDRIIDGLHGLFYSQKRSISLGSRFVAVTAAFITLITVFPTLAEDIVPPTEIVESPSAQPTASVVATPTPVAVEQVDTQTAASTPSPSPSVTEEEDKVKVVKDQPRISFRFPNSVAIDPRAVVAKLPEVAMTGGSIGMVCISSNAIIDIGVKNLANNDNEGALLIAGDLSPQVKISGSFGAINSVINSGGGLRVSAAQGRLSNSSISFSYVELTGADLSQEFCGKAQSQRSISFRALDLQMDTVKTRIDFNKPSGR